MPPETTAENDQLEDRRPVAALTTASNHPAVVGEDLGYLLSSTPNIDLSTIRLIPNDDGTVGIAARVGPAECPSCHAAGHPHTEYCRAENREYPGQPGKRPEKLAEERGFLAGLQHAIQTADDCTDSRGNLYGSDWLDRMRHAVTESEQAIAGA